MRLSYLEMLDAFRKSPLRLLQGEILSFKGTEKFDVYNPSVIDDGNGFYLAARVESRDSDFLNTKTYDPKIMFFKQTEGSWTPVKNFPTIENAEDPYFSCVSDGESKKILFGFVRVHREMTVPTITTHLLLSKSLESLSEKDTILEIPNMKDIRLIQLPDKKIVVCGRPEPQNEPKRPSLLIAESISDLTPEDILNAETLNINVTDNVIIGNNELHLLTPHEVGVLGQVAYMDDENNKHYSSATWRIDLNSKKVSTPKIIATHLNFPKTDYKIPSLSDVVYSGSLVSDKHKVTLYAGISDTNCGKISFDLALEDLFF